MTNFFIDYLEIVLLTIRDLAPVVILIGVFQFFVLKQKIPHLKNVLIGLVLVVLGLSMFLMGLEKALFPIGNIMASQLSDPDFIAAGYKDATSWAAYYWIYIFAAMIGFATSIAEPSVIAVAMKASEASGGSISQWGLRLTVAIGASVALVLGTFRIVTGTPLYLYILGCYVIVIVLTIFSPKNLIPLAYDSGGVATSTVTVPIVAALGLGLSSTVPGRNPMIDGFGLIAFTCLFPIIAVLTYAQLMNLKRVVKSKYQNSKLATKTKS